ncbi:MAG: hypothetical protein ABI131_04270, partial [Nostocoides sp.]
GGQLVLHFSVTIAANLPSSVTEIVNDGISIHGEDGLSTTGSPHTTAIAPAHAVSLDPATASGGAKDAAAASYIEHVTNDGYQTDSYAITASGGWPTAAYDATCTTPLTTTATVAAGDSVDVCVKVDVPVDAAEAETSTSTVTVTSSADATVHASATLTTYAAAFDTLLVDGGNLPAIAERYKAAVGGTSYGYWDLTKEPNLPQAYLTAHRNVVWWTSNAYPAPITPYESELKAFLDGGGRLMMSGQDILDQAAGTTSFVHDYLHVDWNGTEVQNDQATGTVTGVPGNPVTGSAGILPLDHLVLGANYEDQVTPIDPATAAFKDDTRATDGLTVSTAVYKVFFMAFPFESVGSATDRSALMASTLSWFGTP